MPEGDSTTIKYMFADGNFYSGKDTLGYKFHELECLSEMWMGVSPDLPEDAGFTGRKATVHKPCNDFIFITSSPWSCHADRSALF
jgi:hypothetical protein